MDSRRDEEEEEVAASEQGNATGATLGFVSKNTELYEDSSAPVPGAGAAAPPPPAVGPPPSNHGAFRIRSEQAVINGVIVLLLIGVITSVCLGSSNRFRGTAAASVSLVERAMNHRAVDRMLDYA